MENKQKTLLLLASEVMISEEDKQNPVFLSIHLKLADNTGNLNDQGITEQFIDDLIARQEEFDCLPFYADVKNLLARNYDKLGHMYNRITKKFGTTQIGSLTDFYSERDEDGVVSLYATARVPKRENELCIRLVELYEMDKLCVSFEIRYNPDDTVEKDGVQFIDASEDNALTGIALVSTPACPDAVALDMVAEANDSDDIVAECNGQAERGENNSMKDNEKELNAEATEEVMNAEAETQETPEAETEIQDTAVAEGEGASESGAGASDGDGEGASESGGGSDGSGSGGSGGSEGDDGDDDDDDPQEDVAVPTIDPSEEENRANAETDEANAEVVSHSVDVYESVEKCPYDDKPVHVIEYHERIIETIDEAGAVIAELETQIAELQEIKVKYDAIIAEAEAKELNQKRENAKAFAEKQGLNVEDTAVAEAIEKLDYAKIAELTMAEAQEEEEEKPANQVITLASFVELDISDDKYGGLLGRRNK